MKTVYLIAVKLKNMITKDLFFFLILTIGVITCNLMFTYGYGMIMQVNERDGIDDFYLYNTNSDLGISQIENELSDYSAVIYYYSPLDKENCSLLVANDSQIDRRSVKTSRDIFNTNVVLGNINNLKQPGSVIVPRDIKGVGMGDTITLNGYEFSVAGSSISDDFIISAETFESSGFVPAVVSIDVPYRQIAKLGNTLHEVFGADFVIEESKGEGLDDNSKSSLAVIAVIYVLCVLSFMYLMISIYDDSAYELNVYEILGATRREIISIVGGVMLVVISFISFISQIIHAVFYDAFFKKLNIVSNYIYTFADYLTMFFITLISVYAFVFLYIIVRTRKSTIVNSRKFIK